MHLLRWQRLRALQQSADLLQQYLDGILIYCHRKVPFGVGEVISENIRRGRGYRDQDYLLLKVRRPAAEGRRLRAV